MAKGLQSPDREDRNRKLEKKGIKHRERERQKSESIRLSKTKRKYEAYRVIESERVAVCIHVRARNAVPVGGHCHPLAECVRYSTEKSNAYFQFVFFSSILDTPFLAVFHGCIHIFNFTL